MKVPRPEIAKIIRMRRAGARMVDIINETHRSEHTIRKIFERIPVRQREKIAAKNEKTGQARRPPPKLNPMKSPKFTIHAAYCQAVEHHDD